MNVVEELQRIRERHRELDFSIGGELLAIRQEIRTERRIAEDRHETLWGKLDAIEAQLTELALLLKNLKPHTNGTNGTNGTGHHE